MADKASRGKTRAGGEAQPFPWSEALEGQLERTKQRLTGLATDPKAELERMVAQYLPTKADTPEERHRKLTDLAYMYAGAGIKGVKPYGLAQEGAFYRVSPEAARRNAARIRGNLESGGESSEVAAGTPRGDVPEPFTGQAFGELIAGQNFPLEIADRYTRQSRSKPYALPPMSESSLAKQSAIGRVFELAATDSPQYKKAIFAAYKKQFPRLVEQANAKNYDDLVEKAYIQLAKETEQQFKELPVNMSFHKAGEGNYRSSGEMLHDVHKNKHLYVFQGGSPHDFLNRVDPDTGLNTNEMFRAVHDFFGHATHGVQFGPKGEEVAWLAHSQMFSPLARLAMTSETRGQNSFVNYTPINAELRRAISNIEEELFEARRRGRDSDVQRLEALKSGLFNEFQFGPQKSVLLPPEFTLHTYEGGMPSYVQPLIEPKAGTTAQTPLTHFSAEPGLTVTDPQKYGSGIVGAEAERLKGVKGAVVPRTYFYAGEPEFVIPEAGLGPHRYRSEAQSLYDLSQDPLSLQILAREANRVPFTAAANAGLVRGSQALADLERMIKEYGYEGYLQPGGRSPAAAVFYPKEVISKAEGGAAKAKTRAGGPAKPFPWEEALEQQYQRTKQRLTGLATEPEAELQRIIQQYLPSKSDSPAERLQKLEDLAMGFAGTTIGRVGKTKVKSTVYEPERMAFPGIYQRPDVIAAEAASRVAPESPNLQQVFGVTREDLYQMGKGRKGNLPGNLPGAAAKPRGSAAAARIMTEKNAQRLIDTMAEAEKHPALVQGMDPWYVMDPVYQRMEQLLGRDKAIEEYQKLNTLMGMASPGSEVLTEIPRGTSAYYLHSQGRFPEFVEFAGMPEAQRGANFPADIRNVPGHMYHKTSQALPMQRYLETGELQMDSPKVPMYIEASGVPQTGFQTATPVGDAHWSRAVGLADTRGKKTIKGKEVVPGESVKNPEMTMLAPWWRDEIAAQLGLESVPAQARAWGTFSGQTGVTTPIGAPKIELLADKIAETANRLGIPITKARDLVLTGQAYAGKKEGGLAMAGGGDPGSVSGEMFKPKPLEIPSIFTDVANKLKAQFEKERRSMSKPGAVQDVLMRGPVAEYIGTPMDIVGDVGAAFEHVQKTHPLLRKPASVMDTGPLRKPEMGYAPRVSLTPEGPYGSEAVREMMKSSGMTTGTERPILEMGTSLLAPAVGVGSYKLGKALAPTARDVLEAGLEKALEPTRMYAAPPGKPGKVKAPANAVGFYNPAEKAALNLQRKQGPGSAFISDMKKLEQGVNDERIAELGLDQLASKPNVTRDEVVALVEQNRIPLKETVRRPQREVDELDDFENTEISLEDSINYYQGGIKIGRAHV